MYQGQQPERLSRPERLRERNEGRNENQPNWVRGNDRRPARNEAIRLKVRLRISTHQLVHSKQATNKPSSEHSDMNLLHRPPEFTFLQDQSLTRSPSIPRPHPHIKLHHSAQPPAYKARPKTFPTARPYPVPRPPRPAAPSSAGAQAAPPYIRTGRPAV